VPETTQTAATAVPRWWREETPPANLAQIVVENARRTPDRVVINRREGATWTPVTAAGFAAEVDRLALGFVAAGVAAGDRVGLMAKTRYEWTLVDVALWTVGAVTVPVYETSSAEQLRWILADSGAVGVVVETRGHAELLAGVAADLPDLSGTWTIEPVPGHRSLLDVVADGEGQDRAEQGASGW